MLLLLRARVPVECSCLDGLPANLRGVRERVEGPVPRAGARGAFPFDADCARPKNGRR